MNIAAEKKLLLLRNRGQAREQESKTLVQEGRQILGLIFSLFFVWNGKNWFF